MIFMKIWERYFIQEFLKIFLLFIFSFYGLYILIDYSTHSNFFYHLGLTFHELCQYYLFIFIRRMDILIPFALLIATIRTLSALNVSNEISTLLAAGISLKKLLSPFVFLGLLFTAFLYLNHEVLVPNAMKQLRLIEDSHLHVDEKHSYHTPLQTIPLEDHTTLIYYSYDTARDLLFDAYWLRSPDEIIHMKYLFSLSKEPMGKFVDVFSRNNEGKLVHENSFITKTFPEIRFRSGDLDEALTPVSEFSISKLWQKMPRHHIRLNDKEAKITATLYRKLILPWLALFVILAPAPYCLKFTRQFPLFFIYLCGIFGLIAFYLVINAAVIVGESQVLPPILVIGVPFLVCFLGSFWKYWRTVQTI